MLIFLRYEELVLETVDQSYPLSRYLILEETTEEVRRYNVQHLVTNRDTTTLPDGLTNQRFMSQLSR